MFLHLYLKDPNLIREPYVQISAVVNISLYMYQKHGETDSVINMIIPMHCLLWDVY